MSPILEVIGLKKYFGAVKAVDGIDFSIAKGTCFGLLGPNGAGKTTSIEIIEGILKPDSGAILYKSEIRGRKFLQETGIQFQNTELPQMLTVYETLKMFRTLYLRRADINNIIKICRLEEILERDNRKISGGQKQRLLLAMALTNDPEFIILDEPTTGLDPQSRRHLWDIVTSIKKSGRTIMLTTHYMEEAETLCDTVAIMDYGRIIDCDTPETLLKKHGSQSTIIIRNADYNRISGLIPCRVHRLDESIEIHTASLNECIQSMSKAGIDLSNITVRSANLEDVFLELTGHTLRS